jgi:hypothetical protein
MVEKLIEKPEFLALQVLQQVFFLCDLLLLN